MLRNNLLDLAMIRGEMAQRDDLIEGTNVIGEAR